MQRIVNAESFRFPEIFAMANTQITAPVIAFLSGLLRRHAQAGYPAAPIRAIESEKTIYRPAAACRD